MSNVGRLMLFCFQLWVIALLKLTIGLAIIKIISIYDKVAINLSK